MAREAGIDAEKDTLCRYDGWLEPLKVFEALVRADERKQIALDKMAENARELGLDYEPVPENFMDALKFDVAMRDAAPVQKAMPENWFAGMPKEYREEAWRVATPPAAQQQWVGLTDDEFEDIELGCRSSSFGKIEAMRKVEAKLKEKNT
jgi:hypothetical protein